MAGPTNILAVIASDSVFDQIEPLMSRVDLKIHRVRSGQHALTLARDFAYDLILSQHPLADVGHREFFSVLGSDGCQSRQSPVLTLTRDDLLDQLTEFLDGVGVQACCIDAAPEQLEKSLNELIGLAVRVKARVLVEMQVESGETAVPGIYRAVNISESGLLLCSPHPAPLGSVFPLTLRLPGEPEPISATGEVVRHAQPEVEGVQGVGLRLLSVEAGGRERLAAFIAGQLPSHGPVQ